jgi:hypothetical protein
MKIVISILIFVHGLIHLLGFVKGFGLKDIKELSLPISKPMALIWLIAALLSIILGVFYLFQQRYSWLIGIIAVLLSQLLIVIFWKDAKYGTIPNILILIVSFIQMGSHIIQREFKNHVCEDIKLNNAMVVDTLSQADINHLPSIVQKYLYYTRSVGQPKIKNFRAEFSGKMRGKPDEKYMELKSVQYNFFQNPSRYFYMEATKMGLPATGLHLYEKSKAAFKVKMINWFKIIDAKGDKLDQAETVTLFNDMCFIAPATLIDRKIYWEIINDTVVEAEFSNDKYTIHAKLYFNTQGELVNFISEDRYETDGNTYQNFPWSTPVQDYKMLNGYFLPSRAKLIYQKPQGDFVYGELEYKDVRYNLSEFED